jgi:hypothetical protein
VSVLPTRMDQVRMPRAASRGIHLMRRLVWASPHRSLVFCRSASFIAVGTLMVCYRAGTLRRLKRKGDASDRLRPFVNSDASASALLRRRLGGLILLLLLC